MERWILRLILILLFLHGHPLLANHPPRKAYMGMHGRQVSEGIYVDSVIQGFTAHALQLRKGDIIIAINGELTLTQEEFSKVSSALRANDNIEISFLRTGKRIKTRALAVMRPYELSVGADINYDWVKFRNGYLRAIVRKPRSTGKLPCILLIPGYGCGSIENYSKSYNGRLMDAWIKNGYAVVTVEKSGMGDSYDCVPCSEADLLADIESYNAGYTYMESLSFADPNRLFIWGHSMGGIVAPVIAGWHKPKGVMVFGTVFRPWSEFLLEMHRVQKPLMEDWSYEQTEMFTRKIQKIYYEFFVLKRSPEELYKNPEYAHLVASELEYKTGQTNMWGRHWRFWQQIDSLNLAEAWAKLDCPVLVINGGTDYEQCAPIEPKLIEETVNGQHPGKATRVEIEDLDHFMMVSASRKEALKHFKDQEFTKGNFNNKITEATLNWLSTLP